MHFSLTKNDNSDIGFAQACLIIGVIHFREFKEWLYYVIEHGDNPPSYIYEILDIKEYRDLNFLEILGFTPISGLSDDEYDALSGICFLRGISELEDIISKDDAIAKLQLNPDFERKVKEFFPFLDLGSHVGPDPDKIS